MSNPKWQLFKDSAGEYRVRLLGQNGQTLVWSEGYVNKQDAVNCVGYVRSYADRPIEDLT